MKTLRYETRDADGNDIVKDVAVKEFASAEAEFRCHVCGRECSQGVRTTDIISGSFTDYALSGVFFSSVREYAKDKDLCFVGVRAAESRRRMRAAKAHGQVFDSASMGDVTVCHPLLWFTLYDVAAALHEYDAPIHPIYKKITIERGENRCGEESFIRLGYITSRDLLNKGTAVFLRINYPDEFNRLAAAYPEIRLWV